MNHQGSYFPFYLAWTRLRKSYCTTPGVGVGVGGGVGVSKMFNVKVFYVMGKALSGELSCLCGRSCFLHPVGQTFLYPSKFCNHLKHNLCFGLSKLYTNIQQDQKAKSDYQMSMLFAYMAGGEGVGIRGFKMFCQRGSELFLYDLCVCVWRGVRFSTSPSVKKITDPPSSYL